MANELLTDLKLRLKYSAGKFRGGEEYPAVDEYRPLSLIHADLSTLFSYAVSGDKIPNPERNRPRQEIQAAIVLTYVKSSSPWEEEWISFWRDHFSIYAYDQQVGAFSPHWEQQVLRQHCFGNFREFLEAQSTHPAMLYYLNNRSSRAGSANENFARELFELHTLGKEAYLNHLYDDWKKVPGALKSNPIGYIDQDVYEAARAFTGWTVSDGSNLGGKMNLPSTGEFVYVETRHDNYQKRILATEFSPYAGAMSDGKKVLDLCANHPATILHLATKLVRRFIQEQAPQEMIKSTAQVWQANLRQPDQLKKVYLHLVSISKKVPSSHRQKALRPIALANKLVRLTGIPFEVNEGGVLGAIENSGIPIYGWPSPDGPPDNNQMIIASSYLKQRISLILGLAENQWGTGEWDPRETIPDLKTNADLMQFWEIRFFGMPRPELSLPLLQAFNLSESNRVVELKLARRLIGLLACAPSFQTDVVFPDRFNAKGRDLNEKT